MEADGMGRRRRADKRLNRTISRETSPGAEGLHVSQAIPEPSRQVCTCAIDSRKDEYDRLALAEYCALAGGL
jgi:hypothetical protein